MTAVLKYELVSLSDFGDSILILGGGGIIKKIFYSGTAGFVSDIAERIAVSRTGVE